MHTINTMVLLKTKKPLTFIYTYINIQSIGAWGVYGSGLGAVGQFLITGSVKCYSGVSGIFPIFVCILPQLVFCIPAGARGWDGKEEYSSTATFKAQNNSCSPQLNTCPLAQDPPPNTSRSFIEQGLRAGAFIGVLAAAKNIVRSILFWGLILRAQLYFLLLLSELEGLQ